MGCTHCLHTVVQPLLLNLALALSLVSAPLFLYIGVLHALQAEQHATTWEGIPINGIFQLLQ